MSIKQTVFLALLMFFPLFMQAQEKTQYRAVNWTIHDGLSQSNNNSILKDIKGFLWIGSGNGVDRFDGSRFRNYYHDAHDRRSIAGNGIMSLKEDSLHNVWIGTATGISRYDMKADTFSNLYSNQKGNPEKLFVPFWATRDQVYALESNTKIVAFNTQTLARKTYADFTPTDSLDTRANMQNSVLDEKSGTVWMLRGLIGQPNGGLMKVTLPEGKKQYFSWPCLRHIHGHSHFSEGMCLDRKRNSIWINSPDGLLEFTLADQQFHQIDAIAPLTSAKGYFNWVGLDLDLQGRIWLATDPEGILIYDPEDQSLTKPFADDSSLQEKVSKFNGGIYCDRDGMTWTSYWSPKGIYQLIPSSPAVHLYRPDPKGGVFSPGNQVIDFNKWGNRKLWISTAGGLYTFDQGAGNLQPLKNETESALKGLKNPILPKFVDADTNKMLIETSEGFMEKDLANGKIRPIALLDKNSKPIHPQGRFLTPLFGNGWLMHVLKDGKEVVLQGNWESATAEEIFDLPTSTNPWYTRTDGHRYLFFKRDESLGNLTYENANGLWHLAPNPTDSLQWSSIFYNSVDQTYWVAADRQLIHFSADFRVLRKFSKDDGMPEYEVAGLIADNNANIWFHTDRSIHQLNIQTGGITMLTEKDGFEEQAFDSYLLFNYKDENGDIYFPGGGNGSGFDRITPGRYTQPPSSIYLEFLEVNQKPLLLTTGINNLNELTLRYDQNQITIGTGVIDFYAKGASRMRYKLETDGHNSDWQYGPSYYTIRFEGLQPGHYTLRMQASTASLQFNGPEKILQIQINPPFWETIWFRLLAGLATIGLIYGIVQNRSRQLKQRNRELEEKVIHRTKELKHSLEDLRETQSQLIHREKMASLGELTAGIAHEIQNPLNFVNNFTELNRELLEEVKNQNSKIKNVDGTFPIEPELLDDMGKNLEKVEHHGKRADAIVKSMLQHSRSSAGGKELTDINTLADEYLKLSYHGLRAKDKSLNANLETRFDPGLGKVSVVAQDLGRVLLNLYNNAFYAVSERAKSGEPGYDPVVTVTTQRFIEPFNGKDQSERVEIRVRDNGTGIPQKVKDKIFQPFFTTKPTGEGTGLGLSMSYDIVTKGHGGKLSVETREGEFTEFTIDLPV